MKSKAFYIALVLAAFSLITSQASRKGNLKTHCGGEQHTVHARWNDSAKVLMTLGGSEKSDQIETSTRLIIQCITTMVTYDPASLRDDPTNCRQDKPPPHRLYIDAVTANNRYLFDLQGAVGGSVDHLVYSLTSPATWTLKFRNEHQHMCDLTIDYIVEYEMVSETAIERKNPLPALVEIQPPTVYLNKTITFTFKVDDRSYPTDRVRVVRDYYDCNTAEKSEDVDRGGETKELHYDSILKSTWRHFFTVPGSYKLCFKHGSLNRYEETAQITVFGGNPQYFVVGENQEAIYVGVPILFRFYGTGLDTRPGKDSAKMVLMKFSCDDPPTGSVDPTNDLGPSDAASTSMASYKVTFKEPGRFRVCYQRFGKDWIEVPNIDDLPDEVSAPIESQTASPPGSSPRPIETLPPTTEPCGTAPPRENPPHEETLLQYHLSAKKLPSTFAQTLATALCIPIDTLIIDDVHRTDQGIIVNVFLDCDNADCDARERMNYAIYINTVKPETLSPLGVMSMNEVPRGAAVIDPRAPIRTVDDRSGKGDLSGGQIVAIVVAVAVVIVAALAAGIMYMGRLGYASPLQAMRNMLGGTGDTSVFDADDFTADPNNTELRSGTIA